MSTPTPSRSITGAAFTLEALESRLLLSATSLPELDPTPADSGSTSTQALAGVGHADFLSDTPSQNVAASDLFGDYTDSPRLTLVSATLKNYEGQDDTVFGTSDFLTQVVIGDGSSTTVHLPGQNTLIQADWVDVSSPLSAGNLVIHGDGTTVKLNNTVTSLTNIINDAVEVSGNFAQSPVRTITSTAGVLTINGTLNGDNHLGALAPVNQNAGPDDVVLNATGDIFIQGAVGGIASNGLQHISVNIGGGTVGNVTFNDTVNLTGNLYIKKGLNVTFARNTVINGDLVIEDAADIRFDGSLTVLGRLRIMKAGNITFSGNVAVTGDVTVGQPDDLGKIGSITFTSSARFDFNGNGGLYTNGAISFGNNVGESTTLRPDSLTLAATGSITFTSSSAILLDTTTPFVITKANGILFAANVTSGNVTIGRAGAVTGNITFDGVANSVQSLDVTTSSADGTVTIRALVVGGGDATVTANNVDLINSVSSIGAYASTLTLKPYDVARAVVVGTSALGAPPAVNRFDINGADLLAIQTGFGSVVLGDLYAGTGTVYIGRVGVSQSATEHQFLNRTTIAGGAIIVTRNFDVSDTVDYIRLVARTTDITVNGVINGGFDAADAANETFPDRNPWVRLEAANNIIVNRAIYASTRISLQSGTDGTGGITVNSTLTNSGSLQTVNTAPGAQRIELITGSASGDITLNDDPAATTLRAAGTASSVVLRAASGAVTQTGGLIIADTLAVWARDSVTLRTEVNKIDTQTINGEVLPGGTGAAITANMTGSVQTLFVTNGGSGYTTVPGVTLSAPPPGGTQATATAVVVGGFVTGLTITNPGAGYLTTPTVSFTGGGGTGASALSIVSPGAVASLTVNGTGTGTFTAIPNVTIIGDGRTVASGSVTINGPVGSFLVTSAGSSYTNHSLTIPGGASATTSITGIAGQLTISGVASAGGPYTAAPIVSVTGDGTGAAVVATLAGSINTRSSTPGSGYTYTPTVVVTGGAANQVVNGVQIVGDGSVSITNSGALTVANATISPNSSAVRGSLSFTTLAGNLSVGYLNASTGPITLTAAGAIVDLNPSDDALPNIVTTGLVSLNAATGIGAASDADIDLTAGSLQATNSTSGNIFAQHSGLAGITITGTGVRTLAGNGSINVQSNSLNSNTGTLTVSAPVSAHGTGSVRLQATGSLSDVLLSTATADISSGSGPISVIAARNLTTVADTRITTSGGAIYLEGVNGVLTMADDSLASSSGGNIRARAQLAVTLGGLNAAAGSVSVISSTASILDAGDAHKDITAAATRLVASTAANSIGTATNPLEIATGTLSAAAATGGITLVEDDDVSVTSVTVGTTVIALSGTTSTVTDAAQADLTTVTNGSISLSTVAGSITLTEGGDSDNHAVSANGTGRIFLSAGGASSDVLAQSDIVSGSGAISVFAGRSIDFTAGSDVTTLNNSVDLEATAGSITQADTAVVTTGTGSIRAKSGLDVTVANFNAGTAGKISIDAGRSILDGGSTHVDLIAAAARLKAGTAAGATTDALETTLDTLSALAGSGGININETNALVIDTVAVTVNRVSANPTTPTPLTDADQADLITTSDGPIKVVTGGNLTLNKGDADDEAIDAAGSGTITLETTGVITMSDGTIARTGTGDVSFAATSNILLSIVSSTSGNFNITAGSGVSVSGAISDNLTGEAANLLTSGLVTLDAETGVGNTGTADIDTNVGSITARNRTSGNIVIEEANAVTIAAAGLVNNFATGHVVLSTLAGTITVSGPVTATGSGNIRLSAAGVGSDIVGSTAISTGINGNVTLLAADAITLNSGASVAVLGTGTIDLEATAGSILFADAVSATTAGGNIRLFADDDVTLTGLDAAAGSITVTADTGSIIDAGDTLRDLVAATARLDAAIGIGALGSATTTTLETTLATVAAVATTGGVFLSELNALTIGTVAALSAKRVELDGTTPTTVGDSASTSDVVATTGNVSITTGASLTLTEGVNTSTIKTAVSTTTGSITLTATTGDVIFQASAVSSSGGDITVVATAGALTDSTADEDALVITSALATLNAKTGVGTATAGDIDTTVGTLRGTLETSGGFFVEETDTLIVHADGIRTLAGNSPISLVVTSGLLTVNGPITAHGSGNIHVNSANGASIYNSPVSSTSGHITLRASGNIDLKANVSSGTTGTLNIVSGGTITQDDTFRVTTGSGDIRLLAATNVALASLSTTGNASVTATNGSITDNGETHLDVIATSLRLQAGTFIATASNHLETTVTNLSALASSGGIFILESDGVTVTTTSSTVQNVLADTTAVGTNSEGNQSDLTTAGANGQIVLETTTNNITLEDGTTPAGGNAVLAHGSGSILLDALAGNLIANADVRSTTGHITLKADDDIQLNASVDVVTGTPGTISIDAETGTLKMVGSANVAATGSSARLRAQGNIEIGNVTATNVSIDSDNGSLINSASSSKNVTATNLRLQAKSSIGASGRHLTTNVDVLTALASTGSIFLTEDNGVTVQNVGVTVTEFTTTAGTTTVTDADQSDLTTESGSNGHIVLVATAGNITLNDGTATATDKAVTADGTGNILIEAAAGTITANADITTGTGHVTLSAAQSINLTANVDVTTTGSGTLDLLATAGDLVMATTATLNTVNGDIRITVGDGVTDQVVIGDVTASNANVSIETTGLVIDADPATSASVDDLDTDITANGLRIVAGKGVGLLSGNSLSANTNAIETAVATLSIYVAGSNGINVIEDDTLTIGNVVSLVDTGFSATVQTVNRNATLTKNDEARQSDLVTTGGNGSIVLKTEAGTLTLNEGLYPTDAASVTAHGSGNILLWAAGTGTDIVANADADIESTTGHITLVAARTIDLKASVDVTTTGSGTLDLLASTGSVLMATTATLNTVNGDIRITNGNDVTDQVVIGDITATNANVSIETTGSILDADTAGDTDIDITAKGVRLDAGKGVGLLFGNSLTLAVNSIETTIDTLSAFVRGSDGINITETNALAVDNITSQTDGTKSVAVDTVQRDAQVTRNTEATQSDLVTTNTNGDNGSIVVRTLAGTFTLNEGTASDDLNTDAAVVAHGSGNILLQAAGALTDIVANANADIESTTGHITLVAARTIDLKASVDVTTTGSGTLDLLASTGSVLMATTATLNTVNGDIRITNGNDVTDQVVIGDITATNANVSIKTTGSILDADTAGDTDIDITAKGVRLDTGKGVGLLFGNSLTQAVNAIETTIDTLSAIVRGSDGINIVETNALAINDIISQTDGTKSVAVDTVQLDAQVTRNTEDTQSDLVTTDTNGANGSIVVRTLAGNLTLNEGTASLDTDTDAAVVAHGSGNILLQAEGALTDIVANANADIESTTGHITIKAAQTIDLKASVDVTTSTPGTISLRAGTGALIMTGTTNVTATGSSARLSAQGNITVGNVTATHVSIDSDGGSLINATGSTKNVTATNLRLQAQGSIGVSGRHLTTNISNLSGLATTGSIYLTEDSSVSVQTVAVTVQDVTSTAQVSTVTDADQSDLTTATGSNGNIVLVATTGDITLTDGSAPAGGNAVLADGSGNILIDSLAGNLIANADIRSTTGHITLKADDNIELNADVDVRTGTPGTISLDAETGTLTMLGSANVTATGSSARLRAQGNITVGNVTATNVSIDSDNGSLINAASSTKNITATNLRLQAQGSIGVSGRHLTTNVANVSALATTGSIYLTEDSSVTVQNVSLTVTEFSSTATTSTVTDADQSDLTTATGSNGNIVLVATTGDITLTDGSAPAGGNAALADGSGNILIDALAGNLIANADIRSTTGHITLKADDNIELNADVDVQTGTPGTISLDAETGTLTMLGSANVTATSSSARLRASGDITVGNVTATNVSIDSDSGSVINAASSIKNVTATNLRLQASGSIGVPTRHLTTNLDNVTALASTGSIYLTEDNGVTVQNVGVTVTDFTSTAGTSAVTDATQSDLTTSTNGNIVLVATTGNIVLEDGTATAVGTAVSANGTGSIRLESVAGSLTANADILSGSGHVTALANTMVLFNATADLTTGGTGTVYINAPVVTQADDSRITSANGDIRILATNDITVGGITSSANVSLVTTSGSIIDAGDSFGGADIATAGLRITTTASATSIGSAVSPLDISAGTIAARSTGGGIHLRETDALTVGTVSATVRPFSADAQLGTITDAAISGLITTSENGVIDLRSAGGTITFVADSSTHGSGAFSVTTAGSASDIVFAAVASSTTGNITLNSSARILETTTTELPVIVTSGVLSLTAVSGIGLTGRGDLDISAPSINFTETGTGLVYIKSHLANSTVTSASLTGTGSFIFTQLTGGLTVAGPVNVANGSATFRVPGTLTLSSATITTSKDITLGAADVIATGSALTGGSPAGTVRIVTSGNTSFDATSTLSGTDIAISTGGNLSLGQVNASGLLDIQVVGNLSSSSPTTSLVAGQLRLTVTGDIGSTSNPIRVNAGVSDVNTTGALNIVNLNSLTIGRGGLQVATAPTETKVIAIQGTTIGSIGGSIVDNGTGTLRLDAASSLSLATSVVSIGGSLVVNAGSLTDGTVDENPLLIAQNGRVTINATSGVGSTGLVGALGSIAATGPAGIEVQASQIQATTQTGNLALVSVGSTTIAGTGLTITGPAATGTLSLIATSGNVTQSAPITHSGTGATQVNVAQGSFTMDDLRVISSTVGTINLYSRDLMTIHKINSTTGVITLRTLNSINTQGPLNYFNVTSQARPEIAMVGYVRIYVDAARVLGSGPANTFEIIRGGSSFINMFQFSFALTGNPI